MYVSSCKSVDISIDVVKYEEGFFQCCQIFYKGVIYSGTPPYDHPIYKTTLLLWPYSFKPSVIHFQIHLSRRRGKFDDFLEFSARYVSPFQFVSDGCQV